MAQISNELNSSVVSIEGILAHCGYIFKEFPDAFDMHSFTYRAKYLGTGITISLYAIRRLAIDVFTCEKMLLPVTKVRIKLIPTKPNFYRLYDDPMLV